MYHDTLSLVPHLFLFFLLECQLPVYIIVHVDRISRVCMYAFHKLAGDTLEPGSANASRRVARHDSVIHGHSVQSIGRSRKRMKLILPLVIFGVCTCYVDNDKIKINEIDSDRLIPREVQRVRNTTLAEIFENAVQAYLEEEWDSCVAGFNDALHGYKMYKRMVTICRRKCKAEASGSSPIFAEDIEDLHFYERKVRETLCLMKCNQDYREIAGAGALKRLPHTTERKFVDLAIYEYLHICYFQKERYQDAANAAFTFLSRHPDHEMTMKNLKYYLNLPDVSVKKVKNLEEYPFIRKYIRGVQAYENEYYAEAVTELESSIESYIESEEECRFYCEGPFDQGWYPEFTSSIANHFAFCLKCKRGCSLALNNVNGKFQSDLLRSHYNYLQFAYYKLGKLKEACAAVASYLLFLPADETMLHNKDYYSAQPKVKEEYFTPRAEAISYVKRQEYELMLLYYISEEFAKIETRFNEYTKKININEVNEQELKEVKDETNYQDDERINHNFTYRT